MRFEPLKREHVRQIAAIEKETFDEPWSEEMLLPELENEYSHYLVGVLEDGSVICYGGFHNVLGEAEIENVAVREDFRGLGLGRALLFELIALAKSLAVRRITLEVKTTNDIAIAMYKSFGFEAVGMRKRYYSGKYDALIMALSIGEA